MKIPIVLDIDINVADWAKAIGFRIDGGFVVSDEGKFSIEDFEESVREYIREAQYFRDPNGFWINEQFFSNEYEQESLKESLFDNFENLLE